MQGIYVQGSTYQKSGRFDYSSKKRLFKSSGTSVTEVLVVVGIFAILMAIAVPSFKNLQEKLRLEGVAAELVADFNYAKGEANARNRNMRIRFGSDVGGTYYVIHTGNVDACTCNSSGTSACNTATDFTLKCIGLTSASGLSVYANVNSMYIDSQRNTFTPAGSINIAGSDGKAIKHIVNIVGRVRTCSPGGEISGYTPC